MTYIEEQRDLFSLPTDYILVQCVSSDLKMGAGIARVFRDKYNITEQSMSYNKKYKTWISKGYCMFAQDTYCPWTVANLVTKKRYFEKPTYATLRDALTDLKESVDMSGIQKVGMPLIGCGLDGLDWYKVSAIIKETFADTDVEIKVCRL